MCISNSTSICSASVNSYISCAISIYHVYFKFPAYASLGGIAVVNGRADAAQVSIFIYHVSYAYTIFISFLHTYASLGAIAVAIGFRV